MLRRILTLVVTVLLLYPASGNADISGAPGNLADLVTGLTPAVVNISTTQNLKLPQRPPIQQFPEGHPFEEFNDFFEKFMNPYFRDRKTTSLGSGFVIDPNGYIVTNNHVVESADEITISFDDETQYEAEIVGRDGKTDLALLKIDADEPLPYVSFGDSDVSRVGDWVVVIGNPFGLGGTVTTGIISARGCDINAGPFDDFIQTDAAINRGNSGGPMFDLEGKVIGISTAIFSPNGVGNVGIGFAVPSALAQPIIKQLKEGGKVQRGWLGVRIQHINEEIADSLGLEDEKGALVAEVIEDSPADHAGLQSGDIIRRFDGQEITVMKKLPRVVAETVIGERVEVEILRDGDIKTLKVVVGELDEDGEYEDADRDDDDDFDEEDEDILGMHLAPLDKDMRKRYEINKDVEGLVVAGVKRGSSAAERGIRRGDVILEVNQKKVTSEDVLEAELGIAEDKGRSAVLLLVLRAGDTIFIAVPIEEDD